MPNTARDVKRLVRASVILYTINVVLLVAFASVLYLQQIEARDDLQARVHAGREYRLKSCGDIEEVKTVLRDTIEENIATSKQYLKDHPNGAPGIPRDLIVEGIVKSQRTVDKLAPIDCLKAANQ